MINTIKIRPEFIDVAGRWYDGDGDLLYAVSSTGGLTTDINCPVTDYDGLEDRDAKWYYSLWLNLSVDVGRAARAAGKAVDAGTEFIEYDEDEYREVCADYSTLNEFEAWVDSVLEKLEAEYPALSEWSGE